MDRRDFLKTGALVSASSLFEPGYVAAEAAGRKRIAIRLGTAETVKTRLATRELLSGLRRLNTGGEVTMIAESRPLSGIVLALTVEGSRFKGTEDYEIARTSEGASISAASEQALLYAVFDFLERQGMVFGIDGARLPIDRAAALICRSRGRPWTASPRFAVRGLLPWPDFLNCISIYNDEDFKAYFAAMLRMRFNMFGMHVYTQNDTQCHGGILPLVRVCRQRSSRGAGRYDHVSRGAICRRELRLSRWARREFFDPDTFGADATRWARDNGTLRARTTAMLRKAFNFAGELGIRTGIGFEPYQNPAEIVRALPPEALSYPGGFIESRTAVTCWSDGWLTCWNAIPWWIMYGCGRMKAQTGMAAKKTCRSR